VPVLLPGFHDGYLEILNHREITQELRMSHGTEILNLKKSARKSLGAMHRDGYVSMHVHRFVATPCFLIVILQIDSMLSGQVSLEDFVQLVEHSSGVKTPDRPRCKPSASQRFGLCATKSEKTDQFQGSETDRKTREDEFNSLQKDCLPNPSG
jgi:hypothetical protein